MNYSSNLRTIYNFQPVCEVTQKQVREQLAGLRAKRKPEYKGKKCSRCKLNFFEEYLIVKEYENNIKRNFCRDCFREINFRG